jgi:hypothetical protein
VQLAIELVGESFIVPACHIFKECTKLIVPEEILEAVRYWKHHRLDRPFKAKSAKAGRA